MKLGLPGQSQRGGGVHLKMIFQPSRLHNMHNPDHFVTYPLPSLRGRANSDFTKLETTKFKNPQF